MSFTIFELFHIASALSITRLPRFFTKHALQPLRKMDTQHSSGVNFVTTSYEERFLSPSKRHVSLQDEMAFNGEESSLSPSSYND